jgi:nucleoid DNA-binding protein
MRERNAGGTLKVPHSAVLSRSRIKLARLVQQVCRFNGDYHHIDQSQGYMVVHAIFDVITKYLREEKPVTIAGFGTFRVVYNEKLKPVVEFTPSRDFKRSLNEHESQT